MKGRFYRVSAMALLLAAGQRSHFDKFPVEPAVAPNVPTGSLHCIPSRESFLVSLTRRGLPGPLHGVTVEKRLKIQSKPRYRVLKGTDLHQTQNQYKSDLYQSSNIRG